MEEATGTWIRSPGTTFWKVRQQPEQNSGDGKVQEQFAAVEGLCAFLIIDKGVILLLGLRIYFLEHIHICACIHIHTKIPTRRYQALTLIGCSEPLGDPTIVLTF